MPATLPATLPPPAPNFSAYERTTQSFIFSQVTSAQPQSSPPAAPANANIYGMVGVVARGQLPYNLVLQVDIGGTGGVSALTVDLLGSLDGVNFYKLGTVTTTSGGIFPFSGILARYITADISTFTVSSGAPQVSVSLSA